MPTSKDTPALDEALNRLLVHRDSMPWPKRRELAASLSKYFANGANLKSANALLSLLVDDPQPEVRKEVAELLHYLPDKAFSQFAAKLSSDSSFFVQKALERALDRRRKGARADKRQRRNLTEVEAQLGSIEKIHGKLAAERARKLADKQFEVLVGETVHDLRNILSPLKSSVSSTIASLKKRGVSTQAVREQLCKMGERLDYLERFVNDMRQYSQATSAPKQRERILDVVKEAKSLVWDSLKSQGIDTKSVTLAISVQEQIAAEIARHQIVITLVHLIRNAIESYEMLKDAVRLRRVEVTARIVDGESLEMAVRDYGPGIHEDDLREYQRFSPGRTTKKSYGTGFGLPTAYRCAVAHGGNLSIASKWGEGTTVTIVLPVETKGDDAWTFES